jgi:hypothetical protein
VHDQRAGGAERIRTPVDDADARAVVVRLKGEGEARRAGADDEDLGWSCH